MKVIITSEEVAEVTPATTEAPSHVEPEMKPVIPFYAKALLFPLILVLPVLCLLAAILRIALRNQPPRNRDSWAAFFSTLLIISGLLSSVAAVIVMTATPAPLIGNAGLPEFDERLAFPKLPSVAPFDGEAVSQELKPLVVVVSPVAHLWFGREVRSNSFGAGALIVADSIGYLFVTARHVLTPKLNLGSPVLLSGLAGEWGMAEVAGYHLQRDLALIWMPRHSGTAQFVQPLASPKDGESIFVIGHPEGFRFSSSNGIVSRKQPGLLQISAAVSPGNSGGPVYDLHGNLAGTVTSVIDKAARPNAENLNFAAASDALLDSSSWALNARGKEYLQKLNRTRS